jgi:hypothetical protein
MAYIDLFFRLRCARDILENYPKLPKRFEKEISEAIGMLQWVRKKMGISNLRNKNQESQKSLDRPGLDRPRAIIDVAAGNCLFSILAAYVLQVPTYAVDKRPCPISQENAEHIRHFKYVQVNVLSPEFENFVTDLREKFQLIFVGIHACKDLSWKIIELYEKYGVAIFLMPCCRGKNNLKVPTLFKNKFSTNDLWALELWMALFRISNEADIKQDHLILSSRNFLIYAHK